MDNVISGMTFSGCEPTHFCNQCGKPAHGLARRYDANKIVWQKFLCIDDYNKAVDLMKASVSQS